MGLDSILLRDEVTALGNTSALAIFHQLYGNSWAFATPQLSQQLSTREIVYDQTRKNTLKNIIATNISQLAL
jgi:hypothetical protein